MGGAGVGGSLSPSRVGLRDHTLGRRPRSASPRAGEGREERSRANPGPSAPSGRSPRSSAGRPSPSLRGPRPYLCARGCRLRRVLGSREVSPSRAQWRSATAGSPAEPLLMACRAGSTAPAAAAAPSSRSSSRAPSRDAANARAPQPSPLHLPRATVPPPAPPRTPPGQRQPAPPSVGPGGRRRRRRRSPSAPRSQPRCDAGRRAGRFLPCRDHPAPATCRNPHVPGEGQPGFLISGQQDPGTLMLNALPLSS
ncbi:translation initiation factor IF-2-like [Phyllostomus hastatus]|uniref:translation initiation factor IF-2-like n=1 Tax=Phyllostomus hastatus TaxID=9423 RepID=UPI001E682B40|nr:translation initiation factor IF-2-like [Phyllostomus hastatus]